MKLYVVTIKSGSADFGYTFCRTAESRTDCIRHAHDIMKECIGEIPKDYMIYTVAIA